MGGNRIAIRPCQLADLETCRALWTELTQHHRGLYKDSTIGGEALGLLFYQHLVRLGPKRVWVAEVDRQVVGLVGLLVEDDDAEVEPIVVTSALKREGIGRALLKRVVQEAEALGVRYLGIRPVPRNAEALSLFYAAGFRLLGRRVELFMDVKGATAPLWEAAAGAPWVVAVAMGIVSDERWH